MSRDEVKQLLNLLSASYVGYYAKITPDTKRAMLMIWSEIFKNDEAQLVTDIVKGHIATNKFPPTPAEIRAEIRKRTMVAPEELYATAYRLGRESLKTRSELVERGQNGKADTYMTVSNATEAYKALPDILKVYIKSAEGLKQWTREQKDPTNKAKFIKDITKLQEQIDINKMNTGHESPYLLGGAR